MAKIEGPRRQSRYRIRIPPVSRRPPAPQGCRATLNDAHRLRHGTHDRLWKILGAHPTAVGGEPGVAFTAMAPKAGKLSVIGPFNDWDPDQGRMESIPGTGLWSRFVPGVKQGALYKLHVTSADGSYRVAKADPFAFRAQIPPDTASVVWDLSYEWRDREWLRNRAKIQAPSSPMSVYELHLGSWQRPDDSGNGASGDGDRKLNYLEIADRLIPYLQETGFTHVEFLPPMEHPFYGSWGYQATGFFAAGGRYGSPQQLMELIDRLHRNGIGVIFDWVPSHFPSDEHGLAFFDGTRLFEYPDPKVGFHPEWKSYVFNYGRGEIQSFLISSAMFWAEVFHVDAFRVDAVASMLYLDYGRKEGEWIRNKFGGRENLEAIQFLRRLNSTMRERHPDVKMIAEESTSWPGVSRPVYLGGLGFDMKWDMGWMHDTLEYFKLDPIHRGHNHNKITFRGMYAFSENFMLALSHDEVVHGKASMIGKMHGDEWQKFANLRALYGYMFGQPGKKLLFMGNEFGPWREWNHDAALEWDVLRYPLHSGLKRWVSDLNRIYRDQPSLHELDFHGDGFEWVDCNDNEQSVISFLRHAGKRRESTLVVGNFTPVPRENYRIGVPTPGRWEELLNSDAEIYGGSGMGNMGGVETTAVRCHSRDQSLLLTLPPLSVSFFKQPARPAARKSTD